MKKINFTQSLFVLLTFIITIFIIYGFETTISDSTRYSKEKKYIDVLVLKYQNKTILKNDTILPLFYQLKTLSAEIEYLKGITESNYLIGSYYDQRSIGDSTLKYYLEGWKYSEKLDYNHYINKYAELIAETLWETGQYYEGLSFTKNIINHYLKINKTNRLFYLYDVLGLIYRDLGDFDSALENFNLAYNYAVEVKEFGFAGTTLTNIGALYLQQNNYKKALEYYVKGVEAEEEYGHIAYAGRSYVSISKIHLALEDPEQMEFFLNKALEYNSKTNDIIGFSRTYMAFGELYIYKEDFTTAIEYLNKAKKIARKGGRNITLSEIYLQLSIAYENISNTDSALFYHKEFLLIYQEINNVKKLSNLKKIEYELKVEKQNSKLKQLEIEKQKTRNTLLIIIFTLAIIVSVLFIILYFQSIQSKKRLSKINKELKKARIKAEESDQLKSHFLKNISHEIRTPLNGIIGFSEMILSENLNKTELEDINHFIQKNSDDLISIIENIVDIAHLSTNQYKVQKSNFEVHSIIEKLVLQIKESLIFKNKNDLKIQIVNNSNYTIFTDEIILQKTLLQLLKNAILYTEKGTITIGYEQQNSKFKIYVKDTGIGISQKEIDVIFSLFRKGNENGGGGIGLSIVHHFIKLLDGEISVESRLQKGSTFTFEIPLS